jgi:hypothetical protein
MPHELDRNDQLTVAEHPTADGLAWTPQNCEIG